LIWLYIKGVDMTHAFQGHFSHPTFHFSPHLTCWESQLGIWHIATFWFDQMTCCVGLD
jgi:hypothetical protein